MAKRRVNPEQLQKRLAELRRRIDAIDSQVLDLLNRRARIAVRIGELKRSNGLPLYAPEREQAVLARLKRRNKGPLSQVAVEAIFREIIGATIGVEGPLKVGVAGEPGGRVERAARDHFGATAQVDAVPSPSEAVRAMQEGRWDALCLAEEDLRAACAALQNGGLRVCAHAAPGVAILVTGGQTAAETRAERGKS